MKTKALSLRLGSVTTAVALMVAVPGCNGSADTTERWVATENTTVEIDWDAVAQAYKEAEGPEDLERRINEIYTGDEVISIAVADTDEHKQVVTGFFDNNSNGKVEDDEKIFTIDREITAEQKGQMQVQGYGPYAGYRSPLWDIAGGMLLGSMIASAFSPGYRPMYRQPYVTSMDRRGALVSQRNSYRSANPDKFRQGSRSQSGREYGRKGGGFGGGNTAPSKPRVAPRGGGRFGARRPAGRKVIRLG